MANRMFVSLKIQKTATILSLLRNVVFRIGTVVFIPKFFGARSIWFCFLISEAPAFILYAIAIVRNADNYGYGKSGVAYLIDDPPKEEAS